MAGPARTRTACPHCRQQLLVDPVHLGKQARCPRCQQVFVLQPVAVAAPAATPPAAPAQAPPPASPPATATAQQQPPQPARPVTAPAARPVAPPTRTDGAPMQDRSRAPGPALSPLPAVPAQAPPATSPAVPASAGTGTCPVCQGPIAATEQQTRCPGCATLYHQECWQYNQGCGVYGCAQVPPTEHLRSLEIPAAHWGREDKVCPACNRTIKAAARRCRHCGAVFNSAEPESASQYRARAKAREAQAAIRRITTLIMVFGVLPCTAPLTAVFGNLWYSDNKEAVQGLPALNSALCKIGLGLAAAQTAILLVATLLYALLA